MIRLTQRHAHNEEVKMSQETRLLFCSVCGKTILDTPQDNAVHGEEPYPFDYGVGLCNHCATKNRKTKTLSYDERIAAIREILENQTYARIEGAYVDLYTASAIASVYDGLNPENQRKFAENPVGKMANIAWKMLKKSR